MPFALTTYIIPFTFLGLLVQNFKKNLSAIGGLSPDIFLLEKREEGADSRLSFCSDDLPTRDTPSQQVIH